METIIKDITLIPLFDYPYWIQPSIDDTWTLGFEIMFYIIMAIPILFSRNKHIYISGIAILVFSIIGTCSNFSNVQFIFITNPLQFDFIGIIIALLNNKKISIKKFYLLIFLGIWLIIYLFFILHGYGLISESGVAMYENLAFKRIVCWGIPSSLIVFALVFLEKNCNPNIMKSKLLILLGDSS